MDDESYTEACRRARTLQLKLHFCPPPIPSHSLLSFVGGLRQSWLLLRSPLLSDRIAAGSGCWVPANERSAESGMVFCVSQHASLLGSAVAVGGCLVVIPPGSDRAMSGGMSTVVVSSFSCFPPCRCGTLCGGVAVDVASGDRAGSDRGLWPLVVCCFCYARLLCACCLCAILSSGSTKSSAVHRLLVRFCGCRLMLEAVVASAIPSSLKLQSSLKICMSHVGSLVQRRRGFPPGIMQCILGGCIYTDACC